ncbi:hypothetical protein CVT24_000211 [Panaeolus cyanescens]|uniref:Uncharacterized protein n=1 Tax=Panaeolus cyanescens TaxID=181874 RepID=A0A409VIL6_9AGAR|nr:hypothetical protein CVT24_000211 [Panaeolus cyanescens]
MPKAQNGTTNSSQSTSRVQNIRRVSGNNNHSVEQVKENNALPTPTGRSRGRGGATRGRGRSASPTKPRAQRPASPTKQPKAPGSPTKRGQSSGTVRGRTRGAGRGRGGSSAGRTKKDAGNNGTETPFVAADDDMVECYLDLPTGPNVPETMWGLEQNDFYEVDSFSVDVEGDLYGYSLSLQEDMPL